MRAWGVSCLFAVSRTESKQGSHLADPLDRRVLAVCEAVGDFIAYWGFKAIHGRIWALLALRSEPLSQVEIAEFLCVSRSLVSGAVAELAERGLVRAVSAHRNAPWAAVLDIWPTIADVLRAREWMLVEVARMALESAIEEAEIEQPGGGSRARARGFELDRLRFLLRLTELAQAFLKLLIGIRVPRKLEGIGAWLKSSARFMKSLRSLE